MDAATRFQRLVSRDVHPQRMSTLALARHARHAWASEREAVEEEKLEQSSSYLRSERFFSLAQQQASERRFGGRSFNTSPTVATPQRASMTGSLLLQTDARRGTAPQRPTPPTEVLPSPTDADGTVSYEVAIDQAVRERDVRGRVIDHLTLRMDNEPPLKQTLNASCFAALLKSTTHPADSDQHLLSTSNSNQPSTPDPFGESPQPQALEPPTANNAVRCFHQRPATAQPRPTAAPPLNCFRPWSAKPMRPYRNPLLRDSANRATEPKQQPQPANGKRQPSDAATPAWSSAASSSGLSSSCSTVGGRGVTVGRTLQAVAYAKHSDVLSSMLREQVADDDRRMCKRAIYQSNFNALCLRQERLEGLLSTIAADRGL